MADMTPKGGGPCGNCGSPTTIRRVRKPDGKTIRTPYCSNCGHYRVGRGQNQSWVRWEDGLPSADR